MRAIAFPAALVVLFVLASVVPQFSPSRPVQAQPGPTRVSDGTVNPPQSPRNASYVIDAALDPLTRTITAVETIAWRNITSRPAEELQFHLYWNGWRDTRSTWLREAAVGGATFDRRPNEWAAIDVTSIALAAGDDRRGSNAVDLTARLKFVAPDDGNADDRTVAALPLPQPVPPGGTVSLEVKWSAHVPRTFARTGAIGNFFFIAQWFPKLGVFDEAGWNCHQFHAGTEFFADYGVYDVRLTVPRGWIVGATGVERERRENADKTTTHRYYQEDVHDFAWTTSPDYQERVARFEDPPLPPVEMRLLLQPEHIAQASRHFDATRHTLRYYGEWFGRYPYGHVTIVDPAYQSGAGGMEYPTLFTAGTDWLVRPMVLTPEGVTIHEAGHQWWYGIVGSNEFEDAWMDEGLNSFSQARVEAVYGASYLSRRFFGFVPYVFRDFALSRELDRNRMALYRAQPKADEPSAPSYTYFPSRRAGNAVTYAKTALWLNTLERHLGWPTLQQAMSGYFERWRFKHPKPRDFFGALTEASGRDLDWFFDQTYRSSNVFDYGVERLETIAEHGRFRTNVVVRRYGEAIFPVDVRVTFATGDHVDEKWDGRARWKLYTYDRPERVRSAEVDPNRVLLLDLNYTNNSKTLSPRAREAATKWSLQWMAWLQNILLAWTALA